MVEIVAVVCKKEMAYRREYLFEKSNPIYKAVEELFVLLGLDRKNAGGKNWNPLGELIKPGDRVVIKPNLVTSRDKEKRLQGEVLLAASTNPAVIRPLVDYAWRALRGRGKISILDTPLEGSDFEQTVKDLGLSEMVGFLKKREKMKIELLDLRHFKIVPRLLLDNRVLGNYSLNVGLLLRQGLPGDPRGYTVVDLKEASFFSDPDLDHNRLRFHRANPTVPVKHHGPRRNEYSIANTVLQADVFINVPKLKTHKKAGVTLSLKNLIGIVNEKYWLPHYRAGVPPFGDEYPCPPNIKDRFLNRISRFPLLFGHSLIVRFVRKKQPEKIFDGDWKGNDTIWRTILDLNKIIFYADKNGRLQPKKQRKYLAVVDGIIAGEGKGPLWPTPKKCGLLLGGVDPVAVDAVATRVMGIEVDKIKQIKMSDLRKIKIVPEVARSLGFRFKLPQGWQ